MDRCNLVDIGMPVYGNLHWSYHSTKEIIDTIKTYDKVKIDFKEIDINVLTERFKEIKQHNKAQQLTCGHKTFGVKLLFEHPATHQLFTRVDRNAARSPKRFYTARPLCNIMTRPRKLQTRDVEGTSFEADLLIVNFYNYEK